MFRKLLDPDNPLMITMSQITDCIFLSLFWILGCFPVVTAGASFAALYDATYRGFRQGDKHCWQRFWTVYKTNWVQSILLTLVCGGGFWLLLGGLVSLWNRAVWGQCSWMVFSGAAVLSMAVLGAGCLVFPILSRFENSALQMLKNALILALANLPRTMILGILNAISLLLCIRYVFPLFFLPSLAALLSSLLIEPMFRPYLPEENQEK